MRWNEVALPARDAKKIKIKRKGLEWRQTRPENLLGKVSRETGNEIYGFADLLVFLTEIIIHNVWTRLNMNPKHRARARPHIPRGLCMSSQGLTSDPVIWLSSSTAAYSVPPARGLRIIEHENYYGITWKSFPGDALCALLPKANMGVFFSSTPVV